MSQVTVIGLGNMGSALARAFVENGCSVTIWNRSPEKALSLVEKGALLAPNSAAAVTASPVVVMCVTDPGAAQQILGDSEANISGKLLIQLTTSRPQEAREGEAWAQQHQVEYPGGHHRKPPVPSERLTHTFYFRVQKPCFAKSNPS